MIILLEGTRNIGKTFLLEKALNILNETLPNNNFIYYKFYFAKHLLEFNIADGQSIANAHYLSIGNILTLFEMNSTLLKDKIIIFDRCILSAYVWSFIKLRKSNELLNEQCASILSSTLFKNCHTIFLTKDKSIEDTVRIKDQFDNVCAPSIEAMIFDDLLNTFNKQLSDTSRNNSLHYLTNKFNNESIVELANLLLDISKLDK